MPLEPDTEPAANAEPITEPQGAGSEGDASAQPAPAPRARPDERLAAIFRQWRTAGRPTSDAIALVRTTDGDPRGMPFLELLGVEATSVGDAWSAWDVAQVASDATPLGRTLRPLVALVPAGGRWTAARSIGSLLLLEPVDHAAPAQALAAAAVRLELVASTSLRDDLDEIAAQTLADEDAPDEDDVPTGDQPAGGAQAEGPR